VSLSPSVISRAVMNRHVNSDHVGCLPLTLSKSVTSVIPALIRQKSAAIVSRGQRSLMSLNFQAGYLTEVGECGVTAVTGR
jgi:hypothetical protein